jgi:hypothetical protein
MLVIDVRAGACAVPRRDVVSDESVRSRDVVECGQWAANGIAPMRWQSGASRVPVGEGKPTADRTPRSERPQPSASPNDGGCAARSCWASAVTAGHGRRDHLGRDVALDDRKKRVRLTRPRPRT